MKEENRFGSYDQDTPYGWTEHTIANTMGFTRYYQIHKEVIDWIYANVNDCEKNAIWFRVNDCIYIRFRRRADAVMFTLKWSNPQ